MRNSIRLGRLRDWVEGWSPESVSTLGNGLSSVEASFATGQDAEEVLSGDGGDPVACNGCRCHQVF